MAELVQVEKKGRVGVITLNRPKQMNALSAQLMQELAEALYAFDADPGVGAIVLTGSDKAFAAGADIAAMKDYSYMDAYMSDYITRDWEHIRRIRKPVIAAVAGYALGGGCEVAMMCDIVIAADNAKFGQPEVNLGIMPGSGGTQRLPRAVGKAKAMDMCLTGRTMDAQEAERAGLVSRVVPDDDLLPTAYALAAEIVANTSAVAVGASCAFLTPIGHQSNTLVMEPGGYRFSDFMRVGIPLNLILGITASLAIPLIWQV